MSGTRVDLGDEVLNEHIAEGMGRVEKALREELSKSADFLADSN